MCVIVCSGELPVSRWKRSANVVRDMPAIRASFATVHVDSGPCAAAAVARTMRRSSRMFRASSASRAPVATVCRAMLSRMISDWRRTAGVAPPIGRASVNSSSICASAFQMRRHTGESTSGGITMMSPITDTSANDSTGT